MTRLETDEVEHTVDALAALFAVPDAVKLQSLGDRFPDLRSWVERGIRILEDDLDSATERFELFLLEVRDVVAVEDDRT